MTEQEPLSISIPDQIMQTLFSRLLEDKDFDKKLIGRLSDLYYHGDMTKSAKIAEALRTIPEEHHEAH